MKNILIIIGVLAVAGGIGAYMLYNKPHQNMEKAKAAFEMSAESLFSEYETDESAADAKYLDQIVQVQGQVKEVTKENGIVSVSLEAGGLMGGVNCELDELTKHARTDFQEGETVQFKCLCTGMLMDVVLVRCVEQQ
ncbi:MAG TPA: hypothetical protein PKA00_00095 [Saprospiraceae bacterium]|nr:hypothetical protein [Saprospiraceae bacterium]HMQ81263.1 hypothetical protein [Saprospiraceae bacterium]